jgi:SAM-dependent methyltransferase
MNPLDELADAVGPLDAKGVDDLLRRQPDPRLADLAGAWLGREAARRGGRWVGLHEPVPPRIDVRGVLFSPIDAARRRQLDPAAPSIPEILARVDAWAVEPPPDGNRAAWDALADDPRFAGAAPLAGLDPWLGDVAGKDLLCLGAGGGRQGPLHAAAGARVTVVDVSERQLEHDRRAGTRALRASMDDLRELAAGSFDIVLQPVSTCYVRDVGRVYAEVARVLRPGGLYVAQHKQRGPGVPYQEGLRMASTEPGAVEYLHTLEALLGGLCAAGFAIEDVAEPPRADALAPAGTPGHRACFLPPYLKVKARLRKGQSDS